jgi:3-oxosteroid 1-dehydrogenase
VSTSVPDQYDVVIVGSGAGGLSAGITAKLRGMNPLLIEKTDKVGGSSALSGGVLWLPNNPLMAREGIRDSSEAGLRYLANFVDDGDPASTPSRREAFIDAIEPMVAQFEAQGMQYMRCHGYSDYYDHLPGGNAPGRSLQAELFDANRLGSWKTRLRPPTVAIPVRTGEGAQLMRVGITLEGKLMAARVAGRYVASKLMGKTIYNAGAALQGRMLEIALKLGVDIWTDAGLIDLDTHDARVEGAHIRHDGVDKTIGASRGVIITAGGFAHNLRMREQYQRRPISTDYTHANPGDTGEAIEAMARAGAALGWMEESWWVAGFQAGGSNYQIVPELMKPHGVLVDLSGQRFVNEARSYMEIGRACYARNATVPAIPAWVVMDSQHRKRYLFGFQAPGKVPKDWVRNGWVHQDDTIHGLAAQCGIDPAGLEATIKRFNGFCKSGVDEDFQRGDNAYAHYYGDPTNKPNPNLGDITQPPFWAVPLRPGDVGTCGGVICDKHARVRRGDGSTIEGLYAAGNCAAPLAGPYYVGAGLSIGASSVFGYIAVNHALQ